MQCSTTYIPTMIGVVVQMDPFNLSVATSQQLQLTEIQAATMWYNCVHMVTLSPIAIILKRTCRETMDQSLQCNSNNNRFVNDGTAGSSSGTCYKPLCLYHRCPRHNCTLHSTTEDTAIIPQSPLFHYYVTRIRRGISNLSREVEASRPRSKCTRRERRESLSKLRSQRV